jgi:F0F1-type ATP synthase assembly protein I
MALRPLPTPGHTRVLNSIAAGRRLAQRVAVAQTVATLATALTCLIWGRAAGLGALAGGLAMTLGSGLAAWGVFGGSVAGGGVLLGRLLLGTALKWIVVGVGLYLAIATWKLPAPAVLAGAVAATVAWLFAVRSKN